MNGPTLYQFGVPAAQARVGVILVHGRGASAESMAPLAEVITPPGAAVTFAAPQAPGYQWYPYSFMAPIEQNEPHLTRALGILAHTLAGLERAGLPPERVVLVGFSQGACLAVEFAARSPRRFGGAAALSGGLIGPPGASLDHPGSLEGTPVFFGCSDVDPHIPLQRVLDSAAALERMGARVTTRIYPGMGHTVNDEEIEFLRAMLAAAGEQLPGQAG